MGIMLVTLSIVQMMYFIRYRGLATGCQYAGWSASGLVFPIILSSLEQHYGFRGALLVLGGLVTHTTALALFLKQPPWIKKRGIQKTVRNKVGLMLPSEETAQGPSEGSSEGSSECEQSFSDIRELLRAPMAYAIIMSSVIMDCTYIVFARSIVDYAMDKGAQVTEARNVIVYASAAQLIGAVLIPMLSDVGFLRRSTLVMITFFSLGVLLLVYPETISYGSYVLVSVCIAMLLGSALSMNPVLMADYLGVHQVSNCLGLVGVVFLPILLWSPSILGK